MHSLLPPQRNEPKLHPAQLHYEPAACLLSRVQNPAAPPAPYTGRRGFLPVSASPPIQESVDGGSLKANTADIENPHPADCIRCLIGVDKTMILGTA